MLEYWAPRMMAMTTVRMKLAMKCLLADERDLMVKDSSEVQVEGPLRSY